MPLWGKTDANGSKPKFLTTAEAAKAVFVSAEEAVLKTNKDKGILGAGWWIVDEYTGSNGETRYKTECVVAMSVANATSGDAADDAKVSDVEVTITITSQFNEGQEIPFNNSTTFVANATVSSGSLTYQWQRKANTPGARWANIAGATSNEYTPSPALTPANVGDSLRYVLGSTSGAKKVTSNAFILGEWD